MDFYVNKIAILFQKQPNECNSLQFVAYNWTIHDLRLHFIVVKWLTEIFIWNFHATAIKQNAFEPKQKINETFA